LTGLEAISANNGWSIAGLGVTIVFTGLVALATAIEQLHKMLDIWENRRAYFEWFKQKRAKKATEPEKVVYLPEDIQEAARIYKMLIERMEEHPFSLPKLLDFALRRGIGKPYSTINDLLLAKVIVPVGDGYFSWNEDVAKIPINIPKKKEKE